MLRSAPADDECQGFGRSHGQLGNLLDVLHDVNGQVILVSIHEEHVANGPVGQRRTEHWDVVLVAPVVHTLRIVYLLPHPVDHPTGGPHELVVDLLLVHLLEERLQPVFEAAVILGWDQDVADPTLQFLPVIRVIHVKLGSEETVEALYEVLLHSASTSHNAVHHLVLCQVPDGLPHTARHHVGGVAQKHSAPRLLPVLGILGLFSVLLSNGVVAESPIDSLVDNSDSLSEISSLETGRGKGFKNLLIVNSLVKVIALDGESSGNLPDGVDVGLGWLLRLVVVGELVGLLLLWLAFHAYQRVVNKYFDNCWGWGFKGGGNTLTKTLVQ